MGDMDNLLNLIAKLDSVTALAKRVDELESKVKTMEAELSKVKTDQVVNSLNIDGTGSKPKEIDVADLAIYEYAKNPPKIRR